MALNLRAQRLTRYDTSTQEETHVKLVNSQLEHKASNFANYSDNDRE